jgi:hypothetical protein
MNFVISGYPIPCPRLFSVIPSEHSPVFLSPNIPLAIARGIVVNSFPFHQTIRAQSPFAARVHSSESWAPSPFPTQLGAEGFVALVFWDVVPFYSLL